ncbi:MAG: OmpA family protein [Bacteroidales bacterium]
MKRILLLIFCVFMILVFHISGSSQVADPFRKAARKSEQQVSKQVNKEIDRELNKASTEQEDKNTSETQSTSEEDKQATQQDETKNKPQQESAPELNWAKYDFVPGDRVIFEDNLVNEENGEFPSRWDLNNGNIEIAVFGGENVIMFRQYGSEIIPYLTNPKSDYLPEIFTVEFDLYLPNNSFSVYFFDRKNQSSPRGRTYLDIWKDKMEFSPSQGVLPDGERIDNRWAHIAIAYTKGKMKAYINETRLINIPRLDFDPTGISMRALQSSDKNHFYIKNIRIAEGGVKYYDRLLQDGKIIASGIRFDVNKATLRPESMGIINEIAGLMRSNTDISFSVEGHTDSDGDDSFNQKLSGERAQSVVKTLVKMGIDPGRLTSKGWGENKPLDSNDTPEGKANNRRVEFVKM